MMRRKKKGAWRQTNGAGELFSFYVTSQLEPCPGSEPRAKLKAWLLATRTSMRDFARKTGLLPNIKLRKFITGANSQAPSLITAFAIEHETGGFIRAEEWLDDPYVAAQIRERQVTAAHSFGYIFRDLMLRYGSLKTEDGVLRARARFLSRIYGVDWAEVKKRVWADTRKSAKAQMANVRHLMRESVDDGEDSEEEEDADFGLGDGPQDNVAPGRPEADSEGGQ